jgi:hypothetical protein
VDSGRTFSVFDDQGCIGVLISPPKLMEPGGVKVIRLEDGREIQVRAEDLKARPDGSFHLRNAGRLAAGAPGMETPTAPSAAPSSDGVASEFFEHDYLIERVAVGRVLDGPVTQRQEGDTLILPVIEEVLVCEKRMVLKEEVRITRKRQAVKEVRRIPAESLGARVA